jgi:hypothetical protein
MSLERIKVVGRVKAYQAPQPVAGLKEGPATSGIETRSEPILRAAVEEYLTMRESSDRAILRG